MTQEDEREPVSESQHWYLTGYKDGKLHVELAYKDKASSWDAMIAAIEYINSVTNDPMQFHLMVGEVVTEIIAKQQK